MTLFNLIKQCLHMQAVQTEPGSRATLMKVMKEIERLWKKEI